MSAQATRWLLERGVRVTGIDQWGWDVPLRHQLNLAKQTNNSELFWEGHLVGMEYEYLHMEQLVNLRNLPYSGFTIAVFPLPIVGASAAPARVVAMLPD
jgi:kynurenine formamidase